MISGLIGQSTADSLRGLLTLRTGVTREQAAECLVLVRAVVYTVDRDTRYLCRRAGPSIPDLFHGGPLPGGRCAPKT